MEGITAKQVIDYLEQHDILLMMLATEIGEAGLACDPEDQSISWHDIGLEAVRKFKGFEFYRVCDN